MAERARSKWDRRISDPAISVFLLRHRLGVCIFIALGTLFLGYQATTVACPYRFLQSVPSWPPLHPTLPAVSPDVRYRQRLANCS